MGAVDEGAEVVRTRPGIGSGHGPDTSGQKSDPRIPAADAAELIGRNEKTIRRWAKAGKISAETIESGGKLVLGVLASEVQAQAGGGSDNVRARPDTPSEMPGQSPDTTRRPARTGPDIAPGEVETLRAEVVEKDRRVAVLETRVEGLRERAESAESRAEASERDRLTLAHELGQKTEQLAAAQDLLKIRAPRDPEEEMERAMEVHRLKARLEVHETMAPQFEKIHAARTEEADRRFEGVSQMAEGLRESLKESVDAYGALAEKRDGISVKERTGWISLVVIALGGIGSVAWWGMGEARGVDHVRAERLAETERALDAQREAARLEEEKRQAQRAVEDRDAQIAAIAERSAALEAELERIRQREAAEDAVREWGPRALAVALLVLPGR